LGVFSSCQGEKEMRFLRSLLSVAFSSTTTMSAGGRRLFNDDAVIRKILTQTQTIALVGASNKPERPSYYVMEYLLSKGYDVIPINPGLEGKEILGQTVMKSLSSIGEDRTIDMVDIFRTSDAVPGIVEEAISLGGVKSIWMQVGVINEEAAKTAEDAGMDVVMNVCPKIEIPRLGITGPTLSEL